MTPITVICNDIPDIKPRVLVSHFVKYRRSLPRTALIHQNQTMYKSTRKQRSYDHPLKNLFDPPAISMSRFDLVSLDIKPEAAGADIPGFAGDTGNTIGSITKNGLKRPTAEVK